MAYTPSAIASREIGYSPTSKVQPAHRRGLLLRLLDAMMESRQHQADRVIARYVHDSDGKLIEGNPARAGFAPKARD